MSDEIQPGAEGQNEQTEPAGTGQAGAETAHQEEKVFDAQYVSKLRDEAAKYRTRLREAEQRLATLEAAAKKSQEQPGDADEMAALRKKMEELRQEEARWNTERRDYELRFAVATAAPKRALDAQLAVRLLDKEAVEFDDAGKPVNIEALLDELIEQYPYLAVHRGGAGTTNPAKPGNGAKLTREAIERMSPEEINRRWDEVSAVLSGK